MLHSDETVKELIDALQDIVVRDVMASEREGLERSAEAYRAICILERLGMVPFCIVDPKKYAETVIKLLDDGYARSVLEN